MSNKHREEAEVILDDNMSVISSAHIKKISYLTEFIIDAMMEFSMKMCMEQRKICASEAVVVDWVNDQRIDLDKIKNAPLATEKEI